MLVAAKAASHSSPIILVIYIIVFGAFYFFYLRPRSKKQKAARTQNRQVEVGDRARTIGGFVGTIVKRTDDLVTLRSDSGVELDFIPSAIAGRHEVVVAPEAIESPAPETQEGDSH